MKRTVPLIVLVGTAGLLVPLLAASGESPSCPGGKAQWASGCCDKSCAAAVSCTRGSCCTKTVSKNDSLVGELTAILNETKSAETFLVTTMVLGRLGAEAKSALPAIIRNAERLEVFEDLFDANASAGDRAASQKVVDALEMILDKKVGTKERIRQIPGTYPAPSAYPVPCAPVCPAPAVNWSTPAATPTPVPATPPMPVKPTSEGVIKPVPSMVAD